MNEKFSSRTINPKQTKHKRLFVARESCFEARKCSLRIWWNFGQTRANKVIECTVLIPSFPTNKTSIGVIYSIVAFT